MAKLALFSSGAFGLSDQEETFVAQQHMVEMAGKKNPIIGEIKTYRIFNNLRKSLVKGNIRHLNRVLFSVFDAKNKTALKELMDCDIIYLEGGNTFEISYALQITGMYKFLNSYAKKGGVIAGTSAGSIICTPSILSAQWADNMSSTQDKIPSYDGLGLTDFCLKPHSQSYMPNYLNPFQDFCNMTAIPFKCIPDGGAVIVDGDEIFEYGDVQTLTPY